MIAILGGTFDPIHHGHLRLALNLKQQIGFEVVHFIPSAQPPHRKHPQRSAAQRYQMVKLALQNCKGLYANDCELRRDKPSYMLDTLQDLRRQWGQNKAISLILGSDAFMQLHKWHRWQQLLNLCHIIVVARPGEPPLENALNPKLKHYFKQAYCADSADLHKQAAGLIHLQHFPDLDISATQIRQQLAQGENARYLLPDAVLDYIDSEQLYHYQPPAASANLQAFIQALQALAKPETAQKLQGFFKAEYSQGDQFLGVYVPQQRTLLKAWPCLSLDEIAGLLYSPYHEQRMCATLSLISQYPQDPQAVFDFSWQHRNQFNNWDIVDTYAPKILGQHLKNRSKAPLYQLAHSGKLWQQRQAIVACLPLIRDQQFDDCLQLLPLFFENSAGLLHSASGWLLREIGQQQQAVLCDFLNQHAAVMPRLMLRTAIERQDPCQQQYFIQLKATH